LEDFVHKHHEDLEKVVLPFAEQLDKKVKKVEKKLQRLKKSHARAIRTKMRFKIKLDKLEKENRNLKEWYQKELAQKEKLQEKLKVAYSFVKIKEKKIEMLEERLEKAKKLLFS